MGETKAAARRALLEFLAQWEATINSDPGDLKIAPLAQCADDFIDSVVNLVVEQVKGTADVTCKACRRILGFGARL